jgi:hypothetical protein
VNRIAICYAAIVCVILVMPPNLLAGETLAGVLVVLGLLYRFEVRKRFRGPDWAHVPTAEKTERLDR